MFGIIDDSCRYVATFGDYPDDKEAFIMSHQTLVAASPRGDRCLLAITFTESDDPDVVIMRYPLRAPR